MPRASLRVALAAALTLLVVVGTGTAAAGPFTSGPLVQVSGPARSPPVTATTATSGEPTSSTARSNRTSWSTHPTLLC